MSAYSFLNVNATIVGPGGAFNMASGAAAAEEGITIEPVEDKNTMVIGADGLGQHTLNATDAGTITVRLLKTSPVNGQLQLMYNLQKSSSAVWGSNTIVVADPVRGDLHTCQLCAFKKKPAYTYDKAGPMVEWTFDSIKVDSVVALT